MELCWSAQASAAATGALANAVRTSKGGASIITAETAADHLRYLREFKVLVCREHATAVQNLDAHLRKYHAVPAQQRSRIVEKYSGVLRRGPGEVKLPSPGARPIEVLGDPLEGFQCRSQGCDHITLNESVLKKHCKTKHGVSWVGDTSTLFQRVKVQTFFRAGGLQRYFVVRGQEEPRSPDRKNLDALLAEWKVTLVKHEKEMQVMGREVERTDRTGWFNRTGWPEHFKERNLAYLAHAVRLPGKEEVKLKRAARVVELLIEQSVAGLASCVTLTRTKTTDFSIPDARTA